MKLLRISLAAALIAVTAAPPASADEDVVVRERHAAKRVMIKRVVTKRIVSRDVYVSRAERDGALLYSRKVLSREYAYPRLSPGLLPTSVAVAYDYYYVPDYGFAYRLAPPVSPGATCVAAPQLMYNSRGEFAGYGEGLRCY
jgi:hypothetical protein